MTKGRERTVQVNKQTYTVYSDFDECATFAVSADGEKKKLCGGGYIHNELTVRKAIAMVFHLPTFRK